MADSQYPVPDPGRGDTAEDAQHSETKPGGAQGEAPPHVEGDGVEGRDVPPPNPRPGGNRDPDDPWLGGG